MTQSHLFTAWPKARVVNKIRASIVLKKKNSDWAALRVRCIYTLEMIKRPFAQYLSISVLIYICVNARGLHQQFPYHVCMHACMCMRQWDWLLSFSNIYIYIYLYRYTYATCTNCVRFHSINWINLTHSPFNMTNGSANIIIIINGDTSTAIIFF